MPHEDHATGRANAGSAGDASGAGSDPFAGLEPAGLWRHFAAITRIPRPSKREERMADYVRSWASALGHQVSADRAGNLCVRAPAAAGAPAAARPVVLQSHLDMVCERDAGSPYDAEQGNIHVVRDGEWVLAVGTTLGADNGIGVAAMLYAGEAPGIRRGPLELLFTIDEETGLTGAKELDAGLVTGRTLINLDSEEDGIVYIGCAGGSRTSLSWSAARVTPPAGWVGRVVRVSGLKGGHSGCEIHRNRMNAIRAMARLAQGAACPTGGGTPAAVPLGLASIAGGDKTNAIPRECWAVVFFPDDREADFRAGVERGRAALLEQHRGADDGLRVSIEAPTAAEATGGGSGSAGAAVIFGPDDSLRLLDLLHALPTGVLAMSQDVPGLVETSNNLAVVRTTGDGVRIDCSSRSSVAPALRDTCRMLESIGRLAGAGAETAEGYPGWRPDPSSRVLGVTRAAYRRLFGADPTVTAIHAGLECGIIGERVPEMDMVSFGPQIEGVHAPGERVNGPSVGKFWSLLSGVLEELAVS